MSYESRKVRESQRKIDIILTSPQQAFTAGQAQSQTLLRQLS